MTGYLDDPTRPSGITFLVIVSLVNEWRKITDIRCYTNIIIKKVVEKNQSRGSKVRIQGATSASIRRIVRCNNKRNKAIKDEETRHGDGANNWSDSQKSILLTGENKERQDKSNKPRR